MRNSHVLNKGILYHCAYKATKPTNHEKQNEIANSFINDWLLVHTLITTSPNATRIFQYNKWRVILGFSMSKRTNETLVPNFNKASDNDVNKAWLCYHPHPHPCKFAHLTKVIIWKFWHFLQYSNLGIGYVHTSVLGIITFRIELYKCSF